MVLFIFYLHIIKNVSIICNCYNEPLCFVPWMHYACMPSSIRYLMNDNYCMEC